MKKIKFSIGKRNVMSKLIVEYDPEYGKALSDSPSKNYVEYVINNKDIVPHIVVGTCFFIMLFRVAVAEGKIKPTEIEFLFEEETIEIDKYGTYNDWPKGFADADIDVLKKLLFFDPENQIK